MKNFLSVVYSVFESFGKARAATYFVRQGNYEAAKKVMQE
jgi:hypothetical protein